MPFVRGFLRIGRRNRPGRPEGPVDPDYGIDEGLLPEWPEGPEVEPPDVDRPPFEKPLPSPPPGIWPPPVPGHPIQPVPPEEEGPGVWPPVGSIWPPVNPPGWKPTKPPGTPGQPLPTRKMWVLAYIPGYGVKYICVDLNAIVWPDLPERPQPK